jgi:hypothetical protein
MILAEMDAKHRAQNVLDQDSASAAEQEPEFSENR